MYRTAQLPHRFRCRKTAAVLSLAFLAHVSIAIFAAEFDAAPNAWTKLDRATIEGRRWDVPVGYSPELRRGSPSRARPRQTVNDFNVARQAATRQVRAAHNGRHASVGP